MEQQFSSKRTIAAIAGILFFSFFLKKTQYYQTLINEEKTFIDEYCKIGNYNILLCLGTIIGYIIKINIPGAISEICYLCCGIGMLLLSFRGIILAINNVSPQLHFQTFPNKIQILKAFLPLYNLKQRYTKEEYQTPNRWFKESIFRWEIISIARLIGGKYPGMLFSGFFLIRILLLIFNLDLIPNEVKKNLNKLFRIYPHEIIAYLRGIKSTITSEQILQKKAEYQQIEKIQRRLLEYIIAIIISIGSIRIQSYFIEREPLKNIILMGGGRQIIRILIIGYYKKGLPEIPLISDFTKLFTS